MKLLSINSVAHGSTGNIMLQISDYVKAKGGEVFIAFPKGRHAKKININNAIKIGGRFSEDMHILLSRITGLNGCFSIISTLFFIRKISIINPDVVHLHNLHNAYINLPILFTYLKKKKKNVVWTLHDCWSFTGHCPHFLMAKCEKWKTGCFKCSQYKKYPKSYIDDSKLLWKLKKRWFCGVENMKIVTPSEWLANMVKESFLNEYSIQVINNGIDLSIFKYEESQFRKQYCCEEKYIVLGVAYKWNKSKGIDIFIDLSKRLGKKYQIVLVGTNERVVSNLPDSIICIDKTKNQKELAKLYSAADVFVNPTRQEVLGLVNLEALACGTPVVTFDSGGSAECIDESCGVKIPTDDINKLEKEIKRICCTKSFSRESCEKRASQFNKNIKYDEYFQLYQSFIK